MQEDNTVQTPPPPSKKDTGASLIWRMAQIVLVLAASYFYFLFGSVGGILQRDRLIGNEHTVPLIQTALLGIAIGLCIGLALKNLSNGQFRWSVDWLTLLINLAVAGVFAFVAISYAVAAVRNTEIITGAIKDATWLSPLLPFVWIGLTLTTLIRPKQN
jgi:hypothetical protein